MSIYHPYACLDEKSHIIIRHVKNQKELRLSRSKGNVNLTDFWFSILDSLETNSKSCSCQNIVLLSDVSVDEDDNWWVHQDGKRICIGFLKIAGRYSLSTQEVMKGLDKIIGENGRLFRTLDNADVIVVLSAEEECREELDEIVRKIINYKKDKDPIYFSRFFVYGSAQTDKDFLRINIEEEQKDKEEEKIEAQFCDKHSRYEDGWCAQMIDEMLERIKEFKEDRNKKMMSYYQALLQILNVLGQYEQEKIRKDLFYIFYPPISTFVSQLEESWKEVKKMENEMSPGCTHSRKIMLMRERQELKAEIESSIAQFLDTMELLMHHIGQSCEGIVWSNGHGGMPYDIPLRISLMYISFLSILSDVLVEDEREVVQRREFVYCFSPLAYTQPATTAFNIGNTEKTKLIRVKMPRHILFMPRPFLVVLAHEASHYAHETSRCRIDRAKCMGEILEHVCTLLLLRDVEQELDGKSDSEYEILDNYLKTLSCGLQEYLEKAICDAVEKDGGSETQKYYLDVLTERLHDICQDIFYDEGHNLETHIVDIDEATLKAIRNSKKEGELYESIIHIQKKILKNAEHAIHDEKLHLFLDNMKRAFREIYADFSAIRLLQLSWEDYLEAYIIAESESLLKEEFPTETLNRFAMVKYVLEKHGAYGWKKEKGNKKEESRNAWQDIQKMKESIKEYVEQIKAAVQSHEECAVETENWGDLEKENDWFYYKPFLVLEAKFFSECDDFLQEYIKKKEKEKELALLRNLYKSFAVKPQNEDGSFEEFFAAFKELTDAYKDSVEKKYEHNIQMRKDSMNKQVAESI